MVTVAHLVKKIIEQKPFLQEALSKGIVNNAALAQQLLPEIEMELQKKIKFSAVNMAIRRLSEHVGRTFITTAKFTGESYVVARSHLVEIVVYNRENIQPLLAKVYSVVDLKRGDFLTITQGIYETMLITNAKYEGKIVRLFPKIILRKVIRNLSSLTINISEQSVHTIGLFYLVTRALNWENINIIDIVSTFTEMTFIVSERDSARAFTILKELIERH